MKGDKEPMRQILMERMKDASTQDAFCFTLRCEECRKVWHGAPVPFSKAGVTPSTEGKRIIYNTLYEKEKRYALEKTAGEGERLFNVCPICGRLVCDECFMICDDIDICCACATRLNEPGEVVGGKQGGGCSPECT